MSGQDLLVDILSRFARMLVTDYEVNDALHDVIEAATELLALAGAGVSLVDGGALACAMAFPERVAVLERAQCDEQLGPCVEADRAEAPVLIVDLREEGARWPVLAQAAAEVGIVSVAAIPMHLNGSRIGAMDLYDDRPRSWTSEEVGLARLLADVSTAYVANAQRLDDLRQTADQLQRALDTRIVIEQAKGSLAAQHGISVDEAFERLRRHARSNQLSLAAVADGVVNLRLSL